MTAWGKGYPLEDDFWTKTAVYFSCNYERWGWGYQSSGVTGVRSSSTKIRRVFPWKIINIRRREGRTASVPHNYSGKYFLLNSCDKILLIFRGYIITVVNRYGAFKNFSAIFCREMPCTFKKYSWIFLYYSSLSDLHARNVILGALNVP